MFSKLSQLITKASLSGLHLMIRPEGEGRISVILSVEKSGMKAVDEKLQQVLSQNICIQGNVTELEETFINSIMQFAENFSAPSAQSNIGEATKTTQAETHEPAESVDALDENEIISNEDEISTF